MNNIEIKKLLEDKGAKIDYISDKEILLNENSTEKDLLIVKNFLITNNLDFLIKKVFDITKRSISDIEKCHKTL